MTFMLPLLFMAVFILIPSLLPATALASDGTIAAPDQFSSATAQNQTGSTFEERPQALFNRGNFMMEEQNYAEALDVFRQIEKQGHASGPLFYNMGISYLYLDSLGKASFYFHRSIPYRETTHLGQEGIAVVEQLMRTRGTFIPQLPWYAFFDWFFFYMNHLTWIIWGLVLLNAGVLVLVAGWLYRPNRRIAITGMTVAVAGIILVIAGVSISIWANGYRQGVVVVNTVPIQPQPDLIVDEDMAPDLAYEAYTVTLDQRKSIVHENWVHIRLRNGVSGWIPESTVRLL